MAPLWSASLKFLPLNQCHQSPRLVRPKACTQAAEVSEMCPCPQFAPSQLGGCCSVAQTRLTFCDPMDCSTAGSRLSPSSGACSESCPLSRICHPTISSSVIPFSSCLQSFPGSGSFSNESALHMRPKYWSFSFSISPSNEYSGLISFRIDWFDLAVQGTLKSLLQHRSSKASILWRSAFFLVQLSHLYMTSGKTTALTIQIFVGKVMSLPLNILTSLS